MRFFIDTANVDEIREANSWGIISGVTTNPSLIAREGRDFHQVVREIAGIVEGPISAEVVSLESAKMVEEAKPLVAIHPNIVIKLPITTEGLKACHTLSKQGVKTNLTLCFNAAQALAVARAGATYVSPFIGRLDDIAVDGMTLIDEIAEIYAMHDIDTQIIAASVRGPLHVVQAARAGADIATCPFKVLESMLKHPLTDIGIDKFLADWAKVPKK